MRPRLSAILALGAIVAAVLLPERCAPALPPASPPAPTPRPPEVCPALCEAAAPGSVILPLTPDGEAYLLGARHAYREPARGWAWSLLDLWPGTLEAIERRARA